MLDEPSMQQENKTLVVTQEEKLMPDPTDSVIKTFRVRPNRNKHMPLEATDPIDPDFSILSRELGKKANSKVAIPYIPPNL